MDESGFIQNVLNNSEEECWNNLWIKPRTIYGVHYPFNKIQDTLLALSDKKDYDDAHCFYPHIKC
jgi:hypothetical protein